MQFFDSHCHLQDPLLLSRAPGVVARAAAAGVGRMAVCATHEADWETVLRLGRQFPHTVVPCVGVHP